MRLSRTCGLERWLLSTGAQLQGYRWSAAPGCRHPLAHMPRAGVHRLQAMHRPSSGPPHPPVLKALKTLALSPLLPLSQAGCHTLAGWSADGWQVSHRWGGPSHCLLVAARGRQGYTQHGRRPLSRVPGNMQPEDRYKDAAGCVILCLHCEVPSGKFNMTGREQGVHVVLRPLGQSCTAAGILHTLGQSCTGSRCQQSSDG